MTEKKKNKVGRPPKLTQELLQAICRNAKEGQTVEDIAIRVGISRATIFNWLKRGREAKSGIYCDFCEAVRQSQRESKNFHLKLIHENKKRKRRKPKELTNIRPLDVPGLVFDESTPDFILEDVKSFELEPIDFQLEPPKFEPFEVEPVDFALDDFDLQIDPLDFSLEDFTEN